ncbi:MAG TPA: site-2 protease family protein [Terriglobales bacterium]|jgi:Zn-dependent protease|nr:site-2 protease family protein [Terriglobales bacterium]
MNAQVVIIVFEIVVFLFAISVHESSHAWMANRLGDPTARMLGRVSLNPIRHIDIVGTILLPALAVISHVPLLGWAKPTPVDTRNFKNPVLDDVLTAVIGPISNFVVAIGCFIVLVVIAKTSMQGLIIVQSLAQRRLVETSSSLMPTALLFHEALKINVLLGIFNLIPLPPLDGSHVIRHFLPDGIRRGFDMAGIALLWILVLFGGNFLGALLGSAMNLFDSPLMRL